MRQYEKTYAFGQLIKKHSLETVAVWDIYGEDPNCDFGGHHHNPFLERVRGRLTDVISYAETLNDFYTWGGGGKIEFCKIDGIKEIPLGFGEQVEIETREKKKRELVEAMNALQKELDSL